MAQFAVFLSSPFIKSAFLFLIVLGLNRSLVSGQYQFGQTHVVQPKGEHLATVVWLHGLSEDGYRWSLVLQGLPAQNIKWICPTAPFRPVTALGGASLNAWFDIGSMTSQATGFEDLQGLDATLAHVADLLSQEPPNVKIGIGGFSQGCATALYSAACFAKGTYLNGKPFPVNLTAAVGLSGWLPGLSILKNKLTEPDVMSRAASLPILQCHGDVDSVVPFAMGSTSAQSMTSMGFQNLTFKSFPGVGHIYFPSELDEMCKFYKEKFGIN